MTPHAAFDRTSTVRIFQLLAVTLSFLFFASATVVASFSTRRVFKNVNLRRTQLSLILLAILSSTAEAVIDAKLADPRSTSDPDVVYALFLTLLWVILLLSLVDSSGTAPYSHYGVWAILLLCQSLIFSLSLAGSSDADALNFTRAIVRGIQLAVAAGLLGGGVIFDLILRKDQAEEEDETQPLLEAEPDEDTSSETSEFSFFDEDELDKPTIQNRPAREYLLSFKILASHMFPRSRKLQAYLGGMCICTVFTRVVTVALPLSLGAVVDGLGAVIPWRAIVLYIFLNFLLSQAGFSLVESWLSHLVTTDLSLGLNRRCYDHIMNLSADFHDSKKSSVIWSTMQLGEDVIDLLHDSIFQFLPSLVDLVSAAVVLTYLFGPYMTFIISLTIVLFYWVTFKALYQKRTLRRSWLDAYYDEYYQMSESTVNWLTVSQFGRIPYETQRYRDKGDITRSRELLFWFYESWTRALRHLVPSMTFLAACALAASQIAHQQHKIGDFVVLITYWAQMTGPLATLAGELSKITQKLVNAEKLLTLLEMSPRTLDDPGARPFTFLAGAIDFENVSFSYDGKRQVTDNVTFRVAPGKTVALVGQTGGGKSTIMKLLFRFYDPEQGRILIDGQDIRHVKMETFRKHIAIVPQNPALFNMSILENVRYPDSDCTQEEVIDACKAAALHDKIMTFTKGYQEKVGERGTKLSGGELQRLAIARAILKKADILLLDEATSSVDSITEKQIQASIRQLCAGKTAFVIAHRLSTILHADHILVIQDGKVVEAGTHEELIKKKGTYNELWRSQLQVAHDNTPRHRSRSPQTVAPFLINDLSTSGEDDQMLVESTETEGSNGDKNKQGPGINSETSSMHEHNHTSHQASHLGTRERETMKAKKFPRASGKILTYSKSPEREHSDEPNVTSSTSEVKDEEQKSRDRLS